MVPLAIALLMTLYRLISVQYRQMKGLYALSCHQQFALNTYFAAVLGMFLGMALLLCFEKYHRNVFMRYSYIIWTISIPIFVFTFVFIAVIEGIEIAETRGFKQAKRLSRTAAGWEFTSTGNKEVIWLLGEVLIHPKSMAEIISQYSPNKNLESASSKEAKGSSNKYYQKGQDIETTSLILDHTETTFPPSGRLSEIELPEFLK